MDFTTYKTLVKQLSLGKQLPDAVYIHRSVLEHLPTPLTTLLVDTIETYELKDFEYQVIKLAKKNFKLSLLNYPNFFNEPFPILTTSCTINLETGKYRISSYANSANPPILHRKETLLAPDHPQIPEFQALTIAAEQAGLFENTRTIGFKQNWERLIQRKGYQLVDGNLIPLKKTSLSTETTKIQRHLTALNRHKLSAPMQTLARHGYLEGNYSIFDYGCGKGDDIRELQAHELTVQGWDPTYFPDSPKIISDIVNLGFVINVIENPEERAQCLRDAYALAQRLLVVSAMLSNNSILNRFQPYGDGVLTQRNTFQKYYTQQELCSYLEQTLDTTAIAVAPGIFYIFKDALAEQLFLIHRQQSRRKWRQLTQKTPRPTVIKDKETFFQKHQSLIEDFWQTCLDLGRRPTTQEFDYTDALRTIFGSLNKAFTFVSHYYGETLLNQSAQARRNDILIYFALNLFNKRQPYRQLPDSLQRDIKVFFRDYRTALVQATELLFSVGKPVVIAEACREVTETLRMGYLETGKALYLHTSQLPNLPAVLRVYIGCATQLYGDIEGADLLKIHIRSGKVSLLIYDNFTNNPLPELKERIKIRLREQKIDFFDYVGEYIPQPLYLKSRYIPEDFPNYTKQKKFDAKLLKINLFDFLGYGPTREVFYTTLRASGYKIRSFQIISI